MSRFIEKNIICKDCGKKNPVKIYTAINVTLDPELKDEALSGRLFDFRCSECNSRARLIYPLLYNDMKRKLMVYLIPNITSFRVADKELELEYPELKSITKRAVPDFNSFKEKIYIYDKGLDDMAIELCKQAISRSIAEKFGVSKVTRGYFSLFDRENNTLGFTFFIGDNAKPYLQSARLELYTKSVKIAQSVAYEDKTRDGFLKIDREWADNIMFRYTKLK